MRMKKITFCKEQCGKGIVIKVAGIMLVFILQVLAGNIFGQSTTVDWSGFETQNTSPTIQHGSGSDRNWVYTNAGTLTYTDGAGVGWTLSYGVEGGGTPSNDSYFTWDEQVPIDGGGTVYDDIEFEIDNSGGNTSYAIIKTTDGSTFKLYSIQLGSLYASSFTISAYLNGTYIGSKAGISFSPSAFEVVNVDLTSEVAFDNCNEIRIIDANYLDYPTIDVVEFSYTAGASATVPTVTTTAASSITSTSVTLGGEVTSDGGATVDYRGIVYSKASDNINPQIGETGVTRVDYSTGGTGGFSQPISSLLPNTTYYYNAYASNSVGTSYGTV